ncbi:MAG: hypothetical protein A2070_10215 [Bdellovibrionales bacterium GWC1_52_8]|nr:MAG: hypothetical protein A2Z97_08675 [Bdellovibrionales bacterium GWB1_52_6]OFZ03134.1 MAG: hypothetical protein A2X97_09575 [Bdellovibrionales bacterium GWA1_52_35]OFZ40317.1 MAG: hypothetical protein A2070_10215 [Bdellovibrionales bacterium GWC1_52_8]
MDALLAKTAIEAAHAAGSVLTRYFLKKLHAQEKKDAGIVTEADLAAEKAALKILNSREGARAKLPQFSYLTEESGKGGQEQSEGRWIIDPLDGTTNFFHGFPMFCVSIAAEWRGEVRAGVIYHPILKETYVATRGKGAFMNKKPLLVSKASNLSRALLTTGFSYTKDVLDKEIQSFQNISRICRAVRRPGSAALDLAYTARGVFDGFWERNLSPWDVAAGSLLVTEAGGKVTDFSGNAFRVDAHEILATNGIVHQRLLRRF